MGSSTALQDEGGFQSAEDYRNAKCTNITCFSPCLADSYLFCPPEQSNVELIFQFTRSRGQLPCRIVNNSLFVAWFSALAASSLVIFALSRDGAPIRLLESLQGSISLSLTRRYQERSLIFVLSPVTHSSKPLPWPSNLNAYSLPWTDCDTGSACASYIRSQHGYFAISLTAEWRDHR